MSTNPLTLARLKEMKENFEKQFPPFIFAKGADMSPETWKELKNLIPAYSFDGKSEHAYLTHAGPWVEIHFVTDIPFGQVEPCTCKEKGREFTASIYRDMEGAREIKVEKKHDS